MNVTIKAILLLMLYWLLAPLEGLLAERPLNLWFQRIRSKIELLQINAMEILIAPLMKRSLQEWEASTEKNPAGTPEAVMRSSVSLMRLLRRMRSWHITIKQDTPTLLDLYLDAMDSRSEGYAMVLQERLAQIRAPGK